MTLLSRTSYLAGTLVLYHSLMATKPKYPFVVAVTDTLPQDAQETLKRFGIELVTVDLLILPASRFDPSKTEARFTDIWTKVRVFALEQFEKVVFLDSDMIVRRNMDEIFDLPITSNQVAAVHACACNPRKIPHYPKDWVPENCGYSQANYPDCLSTQPLQPNTPVPRPYHLLNSGMFLCRPSVELFNRMKKMLDTSPLVHTWKFCDQDLIGTFFGGGGEAPEGWGEITKEELGDQWMPLPYYYNALKTLRYIHSSFWKDDEIRAIHYILSDKPWFDRPTDDPSYEEPKRWWWKFYDSLISTLEESGRKDDVALLESLVGPKV